MSTKPSFELFFPLLAVKRARSLGHSFSCGYDGADLFVSVCYLERKLLVAHQTAAEWMLGDPHQSSVCLNSYFPPTGTRPCICLTISSPVLWAPLRSGLIVGACPRPPRCDITPPGCQGGSVGVGLWRCRCVSAHRLGLASFSSGTTGLNVM